MQRATATTLDALRKETNSTFPMITKIGLVEDDEHILVSMREWIDNAPGYKCVCSCANAETALV